MKRKILSIKKASEELQALDSLGPTAQLLCRQLLQLLPSEQRREVRHAAEALDIGEHVAAGTQLLYEGAVFGELFESFGGGGGDSVGESGGGPRARLGCTAVALDCVDVPLHARTLDWMMPGVDPRKFASLLVDLTFTRGGQALYSSTSFAGYLGVLTGVRHGAFSLSINFRKPFAGRWVDLPTETSDNTATGTPTLEAPSSMLRSLAQLGGLASTALLGAWPAAFLTRHLLETCSTYDEALRALAGVAPSASSGWTRGGARLLAPCYVMLVGTARGEGCLVTCDAGTRKHVRMLRDDGVIVTANCDSIDGCDELPAASELHVPFTPCTAKDEMQGESLLRRDLALRALRGLAPTVSAEARTPLLALLRLSPIGNEATVHESILCAGRGPHLTSSLSPWPQIMKEEGGLPLLRCSHSECDRVTWYVAEMMSANSATQGKRGQKRRREVVPPTCYSGSLPRRRGSFYYCERHALAEEECSVR